MAEGSFAAHEVLDKLLADSEGDFLADCEGTLISENEGGTFMLVNKKTGVTVATNPGRGPNGGAAISSG